MRDRGFYGEVHLYWELLVNTTGLQVQEGEDFEFSKGFVTIHDQQQTGSLTLTPLGDGLPEYDEYFMLKMINVTGERDSILQLPQGSMSDMKII